MVSLAKKGIYIVAAKRTPIGAFGGKLASHTSIDLQVHAAKAAMASISLSPSAVDSVCIGNVISSSSPDGPYISRHVLLRCGIPLDRPALTVNRLCGSGFQSIVNAAQEIAIGESNVVLTGGADNMSQVPFAVRNMRFGTKLGANYNMEDMLWTTLTDSYCNTPMGISAENLAEKYGITRLESDQFSLRSQQTWLAASKAGVFKSEIAPITVKVKGKEVEMAEDEHPKPATTLEILAKLPTVFKKNGTVTPGSASGICDGASAVIIASESGLKTNNLKPLARVAGYAVVGVEPTIMGIGPSPAIRKVLAAASLNLNDIDLFDINEAFSPQALACQRDLGIDIEKFNQNGGAIAMGHPVGMSGSRIAGHLAYELGRQKKKYAIGAACIGGGQGIAVLLEAV